MPAARIERKIASQPQWAVDVSQEAIASGLSFAVLPPFGTTDMLRGLPMSSGGGTRSTEAATFGVARKLVIGSDYYVDSGLLDPRYGYAWLLHGRLTALATWGGVFSRTKDAGTTQGLSWQRSNATGTFNVYHDASSGVAVGTVSALLGTTVGTVVGLWRPPQTLELWKDGRLLASGALTTTPGFTAGTGQIKIGSSRGVEYLTAEIGLAAFFTRPMSQAAAAMFSRDPWTLFRNPLTRSFKVSQPPLTQPTLSDLATTDIGPFGARHSVVLTLP